MWIGLNTSKRHTHNSSTLQERWLSQALAFVNIRNQSNLLHRSSVHCEQKDYLS